MGDMKRSNQTGDVCGCLAAGTVLLCCLWHIHASAAAQNSKAADTPTAVIIPASQTLSVTVPREIAKGQITITARGHRWTELTLTAQPLKLGNYAASIQFTKLEGAHRAQLGDPRLHCAVDSPCPVDFEIVDAKSRGTYVGTVELDAIGEHLATATINLLVPDAGPPPSLASDFLKGNALDFDATKDDSFFLSVTNPVGSPSRAFKFEAAGGSQILATSILDRAPARTPCDLEAKGTVEFYPPSILVDAGATRDVRVQVRTCLPLGTYKSILSLVDSDNGSVVASKELKIIKAESESSRRWALLFWVVIGAALSVALNNAFPLRRARADRFDELSKVNAKLSACGFLGSALRGALRSEGQRLWLLIDSVTFVNTRKDAILTEAQQGVQALSQLVAVAYAVNELRAESGGSSLPIRTLLAINEHLRAAEDSLMRSDAAGAQARVSAATLLVRTDCDANALAAALKADITKLLTERHNGDAAWAAQREEKACHVSREEAIGKGRPRSIAQRVVTLELNLEDVENQPLADLLLLERDFYIANVWTNVIEFAVISANDEARPRLLAMLPALLSQLEVAPLASHTQLSIALVRSSLSYFDLEDALKNGRARIQCNPYMRYLDLGTFQFCFSSPALSAITATTQLLDYQWVFDDHTTPPDDGDRCKHFFWAPGRLRRLWRRFKSGTEFHRSVTVKVKMPLAEETYPFTRKVTMQQQKDRASSLGAIQVITFCITTGMAVLASFGAQYGGVLPFTIDWGASVTALLFGFGIDQIRDRAAAK